MAKLLCDLVEIYASKSDAPDILQKLQEMGAMDIETAAGDEETALLPDGYTRSDTEDEADIYERAAESAEDALKVLSERFPENKGLLASLQGVPEISRSDFYLGQQELESARTLAGDILQNERIIAEQNAESIRLRTAAEQLSVWEKLDVPLSFRGTRTTAAFTGTVAGHYTLESLLAAIAEIEPEITVHAEILNSDKDNTYLFLCCCNSDSEKLENALRQLSFSRPLQNTSKTPHDKIKSRNERIKICEKKTAESLSFIEKASARRRELEILADLCRAKADHYRSLGKIGCTSHTALIRGYVAKTDSEYVKSEIEKKFTAIADIKPADEKISPVKLKNNKFFAPAETITTMYSLPSANDIDPTPLTGFFYYFLFGMMLSDAGYGLLIVLGVLLAIKLLKPSEKMKKNLKLFLYCGISTVIWGLIFGSFFGDLIPQIAKTFFDTNIPSWGLLDPMNGDAVTLLIISLIIGFIQIIAGLTAKFITALKNGDKAGAFFDAGLWITLLFGIGFIAAGVMAFKPLITAGAVIAIASAAGLVLTQGREKKGIMKLFSGLASLYDITGYVSDLLSFSRLMALGLTTAAMASVFNMLGAMAGGGFVGVILMLIIVPVGHALCFALNALGAYVHTLRLQYVELFSKFYEGGGKPFKAFSLKNKYVGVKDTVKEEN